MLYIIYLLIFIAALAELLWFGGSTAWSVSVMLLCVAFVAAKFILRNKMPKKLQTQFLIVGIAVAAVLIVQIGLSGDKGGIMDYGDRLAKVIAYLEEEEYKDAAKELEDMQEIFGDSDAAYILSAVRNLETGDVLAAQEDYRNIKNRSQRLYYSLGEQIYKAEDTEDTAKKLYKLYLEAADEFPDWERMQFWAGVSQFEQMNYKSAEYYLLTAYNLNSKNPSTLYYLGAIQFTNGDYEAAKKYFDAAIENGANETICSYIAWYLQEMNY